MEMGTQQGGSLLHLTHWGVSRLTFVSPGRWGSLLQPKGIASRGERLPRCTPTTRGVLTAPAIGGGGCPCYSFIAGSILIAPPVPGGGGGILHPRALRGVSSLHPNKAGAGGLPVLSLPRGREGVPTTPEVGSQCLATAGIPTASPQSGTRVLSTPGMCPPSSLPRLPRGPGACPPAQN